MFRTIFTTGTLANPDEVNANFAGTFRNAGTYDAAIAYEANDVVKYASARYIAVAASTGVTPGTDATKWEAW